MESSDIIGMCIIIPLCAMFYLLIGGLFHPNSQNRCINVLCILFWPIKLAVGFVCLPFGLLFELSKTNEEKEKELKDFIKNG